MKINREHVQEVIQANSREQLLPIIQKVIELEHATIPPYLCGYFTIQPSSNDLVANIIRSVVIEEMLHLTIACNLLNALGGSPSIDSPEFLPDYPGGLPFGIGEGLQVHLRKCSKEQVRDVFMKIEEPEEPIEIPVEESLQLPQFETIGALYTALSHKIQMLEQVAQQQGNTIFVGDASLQVVPRQWFSNPQEMFAITSADEASAAITVIVDQGEGTTTNPFDGDGEPAHYYRFEQIVEGKTLEARPGETPPYAYGGEPVVLDESKIWDMDENPKMEHYREGSYSRRVATQFNYNYTKLLKSLHATFNGNPTMIDHSMGLMYELRFSALQALQTKADFVDASRGDKQTGLSFEYVSVNHEEHPTGDSV